MMVYVVKNLIDGKMYVGKTIKPLHIRKYYHLRNLKNQKLCYFHSALKKHGIENFKWRTIHLAKNSKELNELEKRYILYFKNVGFQLYNCSNGGEGSCDPDVILKISQRLKGRVSHLKGVKKGSMSPETKRKISISLKGRKLTKNTKVNISKSMLGKKRGKYLCKQK